MRSSSTTDCARRRAGLHHIINSSALAALMCSVAVANIWGQTAATTPASSTASPAIACPAAYGIYGPTSPSASSSSGTSPATTPTVSVAQTNSAGGSSTGTAGGSGSSKSTSVADSKTSPIVTNIIELHRHDLSAFDVVSALSGKITGVTLVAVGPYSILYAIDPTKMGEAVAADDSPQSFNIMLADSAHPGVAPVSATITLRVRSSGKGIAVGEGAHVAPPAHPGALTVTTRSLPDAIAGYVYSARLQGSGAVGATLIWSKGNNFLPWLDLDAATGTVSGTAPIDVRGTSTERIQYELRRLIDGLPLVDITLTVVPLPNGFGRACDIITAIGHQVQGVLSLSPVDDSRILAGIEGEPDSPGVKEKIKYLHELVDQLSVSSVASSPRVASVTTQLYYDRDAASVAGAVSEAFPQLKVVPISSNSSSSYADSLILADPTGSPQDSHSPLEQARRMIAQVDEPRPQITVNAWSLQMSSHDETRMQPLVPEARRFAAGYNDALEKAVGQGWEYLNTQAAAHPDTYFDPVFAAYLCGRAEWAGGAFLIRHSGVCPGPEYSGSGGVSNNIDIGYGLGYGDLFDRESPNLVQMMLLVMATRNPAAEAQLTLDAMEGFDQTLCPGGSTRTTKTVRVVRDESSGKMPCREEVLRAVSCQAADQEFYNNYEESSRGADTPEASDGRDNFSRLRKQDPPRHVAFACTRDRLTALLMSHDRKVTTSFLGQFRAAIADYLFQNKMRSEYPDDFAPYLYPASAARLDSVMTPLVEAFNQDMQALQQQLQRQLTHGIERNKSLSYSSNGLITVSVVSGNQAAVQTQSLSYFPRNPTVTLENFAKALMSAGGGGSGSGGGSSQGSGTSNNSQSSGSPVATSAAASAAHLLGGSLAIAGPVAAAWAAAAPSQVTAKVGSGLSMTVTPYALSSDSGAELSVNVTYNENGASTLSSDATQSSATDDLNSRVSEHEVQTLVRMDALKFFEVSTMQSVIARQRAPYKLLDPIVELPLFDGLGVLPGWRRRPEVIYNQSVIFLQVAIMPTAADLGNSVRLQYDLIHPCSAPDTYIEVRSEKEYECKDASHAEKHETPINQLARVMEYHRQMVRYFAGQYLSDSGVKVPDEQFACTGRQEGTNASLPCWSKIDDIRGDMEPPMPNLKGSHNRAL